MHKALLRNLDEQQFGRLLGYSDVILNSSPGKGLNNSPISSTDHNKSTLLQLKQKEIVKKNILKVSIPKENPPISPEKQKTIRLMFKNGLDVATISKALSLKEPQVDKFIKYDR